MISAAIQFVTETATPVNAKEFDPSTVTPGTFGFIITFLVGIVTIFLIIDMVKRVRKVNYRAEIRRRLSAGASTTLRSAAHRPGIDACFGSGADHGARDVGAGDVGADAIDAGTYAIDAGAGGNDVAYMAAVTTPETPA